MSEAATEALALARLVDGALGVFAPLTHAGREAVDRSTRLVALLQTWADAS